jgi:hypothetical protein
VGGMPSRLCPLLGELQGGVERTEPGWLRSTESAARVSEGAGGGWAALAPDT